MSRKQRSKQLERDKEEQARAGEVLRSALLFEFQDRNDQRNYWQACLLSCLNPVLLSLDLVGPDDWKVYRTLLGYAERLEDDHPEETEILTGTVDAITARIRRQQASLIHAELIAKGCRLRTEDGKLWIGPERLISQRDTDSIRSCRDELIKLIE